MSERDPIIHDYVGKPEEQEMLDKLAAARCKVRTSTVESQSNQNGIKIRFMRNAVVRMVTLLIKPEFGEENIISLQDAMQDLELNGLGEIQEVEIEHVPVAMSKGAAISELKSLGCNVSSSDAHSKITIYNPNTRYGIIIKFTNGSNTEIPSQESAQDIISTRITSIMPKYPEQA